MDDETKYRIEDVDRKISAVDKKIDDQGKRFDDQGKRIDDVKWGIDRISATFGVVFTILAVFAGFNYATDRARLKDFQTEIKEMLAKTDDTKLQLFSESGQYLSGQELIAQIVKFPMSGKPDIQPDPIYGVPHLTFSFVTKNTGNNTSGPMYMKLYTGDGLQLSHKSSDENTFKYEEYFPPDSLDPSFVPAQMSNANNIRLFLPDPIKIVPGKYPALLKIYYGKSKVTVANIYLVISTLLP